MKKMTKPLALVLVLAILSSLVLAGCSGKTAIDQDDSTVTVLNVNNYAGGFGSAWLDTVAERFEQEYADYSFEEGKVGIDIRINHNKDQGQKYLLKIDNMAEDVFFPGNIYYNSWVNKGAMLDITDVVTGEGANEEIQAIIAADGNQTILSKMTSEEQGFYDVDGAYYAIPHHESQPGIMYDKDLFEQAGLYIGADGSYTGTGAKAAGPDGVSGTSDDGLPATYDEFFELCDYMKAQGITPFIWTGATKVYYTDLLLSALAADYEGAEQMKLTYTYEGTATNLISVDEDGNITELPDEEITSANGYKVYQSAGRYYALQFLERIIKGNYCASGCFDSTSNLEAQGQFMTTDTEQKRVAFLVEGNWWENEATDRFNELSSLDESYAKENRNFAYLPLPKVDASHAGAPTMTTTEVTLGFIRSAISAEKIDAAKIFLAYCYTDESLNEFNKVTGIPAALDYEATDEVKASLSSYGTSLLEMKENASIVKPYSENKIYLNNIETYIVFYTFKAANWADAVSTFKDTAFTAADYFRSLTQKFGEDSWKSYQ